MKKIKTLRVTTLVFILVSATIFYATKNSDSKNATLITPMTPLGTVTPVAKESIPQLNPPKKGDKIATIVTNIGDIKILLLDKEAPKAVENFITHAENDYYDGVIFHRVINNFMIQGGDPDGTGMGGASIWGTPFKNEVSVKAEHIRGALSMANSGPDTNGSQFFIVQNNKLDEATKKQFEEILANKEEPEMMKIISEKYPEAMIEKYLEDGGEPRLDFGYSVFGQVIEGMKVVDDIADVATNSSDKPLEDVTIKDIIISEF